VASAAALPFLALIMIVFLRPQAFPGVAV